MAEYSVNITFDSNINANSSTQILKELTTSFNDNTKKDIICLYNCRNSQPNEHFFIQNSIDILQEGKTTTVIETLRAHYTVTDLKYEKQVYKPGYIELKIQLDNVFCSASEDSDPLPIILNKIFKSSYVTLNKRADSQDKWEAIAQNYCICNYSMKRTCPLSTDTVQATANNESEIKGIFDITLNIYSPDYFLTIDKFSKIYTGKKLYEDVILPKIMKQNEDDKTGNIISSFWPRLLMNKINFTNDKAAKNTTTYRYQIRVNFNRLRFVSTETFKENKTENGTITHNLEYEYIQPYLVQYQESAYDFIVRVMNRCGEYFYYEKGTFVFGWTEPNLLTNCLTEYKCNRMPLQSGSTEDKKEQQAGTPIIEPLGGNVSANIYGKANYEKDLKGYGLAKSITIDKYTSFESNSIITVHDKVQELNYNYTETGDVYEKSFEKGINKTIDSPEITDEYLTLLPEKDKYIKSGEEFPYKLFFPLVMNSFKQPNLGAMLTNLLWTEGLVLAASGEAFLNLKSGYEQQTFELGAYVHERQEGEDRRPFSTSATLTGNKDLLIFDNNFYKNNAKGISEAEKGRIKIDLGINYYNLYLGSIVDFQGQKYIVVSIKEDCSDSRCIIEIIPYTYQIDKKKPTYPPMVNDNIFFKKSKGAQRAIVMNNQDPLRMNRVRIRFKWQGENDDPSPWVRITLPMATNNAGFNFIPEKGDEAIIDFENDNIEKPYIVGMVYNEDNKTPKGFSSKGASNRTITSKNGHSIIFTDTPNGREAYKAFMPGVSFISKLLPTASWGLKPSMLDPDQNEKFRKAVGGIQFADSIGFYSIDMSTDKRAITINSPIGRVVMSAFTGITITAPNGDVTIQGKNVNIVAGNNITLTSGTFQAPYTGHKPNESSKSKIVKDIFKNIGKAIGTGLLARLQPVDMLLVRTFYEAILRPVGGNLLIKSMNNLCLEAGPLAVVKPLGFDSDYGYYLEAYNDLRDLKNAYDAILSSYPSKDDTLRTFELFDGYIKVWSDNGEASNIEDLKDASSHLKIDGLLGPLSHGYSVAQESIVKDINALNIHAIYNKWKDKNAFVETGLKNLNISKAARKAITDNLQEFLSLLSSQSFKPDPCLDLGTLTLYAKDETKKDQKHVFFYKQFLSFMSKHRPNLKVTEFIAPEKYNIGKEWQPFLDEIKINFEEPKLSDRRKARDVVEGAWMTKGLIPEYYHKGKYTGNILYASGMKSPTYVVNKNRLEKIAYPNSTTVIEDIKALLDNL